jgi:predicted HicB family RNase H-like nuclease
LQYRGYTAELVIDLEARVLHGRVLGLRDVVTFQGDTVEEAERAFRESVDDYLAFCAARGEKPDRPYSGKILLRTTPDLHRQLALIAEQGGQSVNTVMNDLLARGVAQILADSPQFATAGWALVSMHPPRVDSRPRQPG